MRIVKEAEERRNEILDAAKELFNQKGYDRTSTNDILKKVGIARGTLYYHFKSKENILDALIERYNIQLLDAAKSVALDKNIPIIERIIRVIKALNISDGSGKEIIELIHKPQNALMHQKIQETIIKDVTPILTEIIREGIVQGLFSTPYPYECMEMIITYANEVIDSDMFNFIEEERDSRIQAIIFNMERMLGAETGSIMQCMQKLAK